MPSQFAGEMMRRPVTISSVEQRDDTSLTAMIPEDVRALIEPRPLIPGEDPHQYDLLLAGIAQDVKPKDMIEWLWVKDVGDLVWEARRLRRIKAALIRVNMRNAGGNLIYHVLKSGTPDYFPLHHSQDTVSAYQAGDREAIVQVEDALQSLGLTEDALTAVSFVNSLPSLEKIDRMLSTIEVRRDTVLREIERRRFATGQRLRNVSDAVVVELDAPARSS
jgi:hypothetical protein